MDRFKEFENDIVGKLNTAKREWIDIRTKLLHTSKDDKERLRELSDKFIECQHKVWRIDRQYSLLLCEKDKITEMLNGYYYEPYCYMSFIYPNIYEYYYEDGIGVAYRVDDKTFPNVYEAMEYTKSLGVREDWKDMVYQYLGVNLGV